MEAFLNTYLPWGIVIATVVICFYVNIIDTNRQRSKNTDNASFMANKKLDAAVIAGIFAGATICYLGFPIPHLWGIAVGAAAGLALGLLRRKNGM